MRDDPGKPSWEPALPRKVAMIVGVALAVELLAFCGGKTDDSGSIGGTHRNIGGAGTGTPGFAGEGGAYAGAVDPSCSGSDTAQFIPGTGCVVMGSGGNAGVSGQGGDYGSTLCSGSDTAQFIPGVGC